MSSRYLVISDAHHNTLTAGRLASAAGDVDAIILNGDVGEDAKMIAGTLYSVTRKDVPVYVQPGSHETMADFKIAVEYFMRSAPRSTIVPCTRITRVERGDHALVFLPGSDWNSTGQYSLKSDVPSGVYVHDGERALAVPNHQVTDVMLNPYFTGGVESVVSLDDLKAHAPNPRNTVVFCHVPPRFASQNAIDMAYFAENLKDKSVMPGVVLEHRIREYCAENKLAPTDATLSRIAQENGYVFKRENRGWEALRDAYAAADITKAVSGHFHESVHRAHDSCGQPVPARAAVEECFLNASYADAGKASIVTVDGARMSYEFIELR